MIVWPPPGEVECLCPAAGPLVNGHPAHPEGEHTESDHRRDCHGNISEMSYCGGCWGCLAMQAVHYDSKEGAL